MIQGEKFNRQFFIAIFLKEPKNKLKFQKSDITIYNKDRTIVWYICNPL